ncbi:MAG TPA: hypothetical protein VK892_07010 [Pyrinomonadaceae bacterium]|nr:hypothetical protein [Pyrinomonadaceae bacterium]
MLTSEEIETNEKKASERRLHLKLSLEERRRQLAEQAEKLAFYYEKNKDERLVWQGGDLVEL